MAINTALHLDEVLRTHRMNNISPLLNKYRDKRTEIKEALETEFGEKIYSIFNSGSYAKHTAINIKFDLDIVIPFKRDSYNTLLEMFDAVHDFLKQKYSTVATVRKQKVSIGILFYADSDDDIINLDIVPGRELVKDQYLENNKINLLVNGTYGIFSHNTYLQTNIQSQIDHIRNTGDQKKSARQIIRLLKIWKNAHQQSSFKSFLFELFVIKAFDKKDITGNIWDKLREVIQYIIDSLDNGSFKLPDPGNSNNDVMDTLDYWSKQDLKLKLGRIISNIDNNSDNSKHYFPLNPDFEEEKNDEGYGIKGPFVTPSVPSKNQRFG